MRSRALFHAGGGADGISCGHIQSSVEMRRDAAPGRLKKLQSQFDFSDLSHSTRRRKV